MNPTIKETKKKKIPANELKGITASVASSHKNGYCFCQAPAIVSVKL